jgi:hypothetical protein
MRKILLLSVCMLMTSLSYAGDQAGTIQYVRVRASDGLIYFALNGAPRSGAPACATGGYWMIRDENSNAGKQQYAMLLAAQLSGRVVAVIGMNSCVRWVDGEDASEIRIVE